MHIDRSQALVVLAVAALSIPVGISPSFRAPDRIRPNDNQRAAGTLRAGVLRLNLDARIGTWHPDGDAAPGAAVQAFAEVGRAPQIPGPLIRVPAGTEVIAKVTNSVPGSVLTLHGLASRPVTAGPRDTVRVAAGATREVRFWLDVPGTYYYWGTTDGRTFIARNGVDAQLSGAIVVDEPEAVQGRDRILVIGLWGDTTPSETSPDEFMRRSLFVVNGRSWPHTERQTYALGDSIRWRVINASSAPHPMHLHGFYYRVDSRGDGTGDTSYTGEGRDLVVTERMRVGQTMHMTWAPQRAGNWLFHCHLTSHIGPRGSLGIRLTEPTGGARAQHHQNHALEGMKGLVVGVTVKPGRATAPTPAAEAPRRRLRLLARPATGSTDRSPIYAFSLEEGDANTSGDPRYASPPIVLTRGVPVAITVVNQTPEPTAVHWHGIELESYFDGVAGFSGNAKRLSPLIAPADSFEARFNPPRAGTFIYHTHVDELRQQPAGMSGPLIVLDPGQQYDPTTDIAVLIASPRDSAGRARAVLVNGELAPSSLDVRVGVRHRLRLINITTSRPGLRVDLLRDSTLVAWRALAKDGADLPVARQTIRPARQSVSIGETFDFEFTPAIAGMYRLEARTGNGLLLAVLPLRAAEASRPGSP